MKRVLIITYHFPPVAGSSGVQRPLTLARYLPQFGWQPTVLTIDPSVYPQRNDSQLADIPQNMPVVRAKAFDLKEKLSIYGRYPSLLAFPDRWNSWVLDGVRSGLKIIDEERPDVIFSTFPIATAHWIGLRLKRKSGLPWAADFRDSMTEDNYPKERMRRAALQRFEGRVVAHADRVIFTAPRCKQMYANRYPGMSAEKWRIVENGFDEATFAAASSPAMHIEQENKAPAGVGARKLLLHSGILYPEERDPRAFLGALADLKKQIPDLCDKLLVRFRATGHDQQISEMIAQFGVADIVELAPGISYAAAIREMTEANALLIFQASNCNHQIPAKIYEYLRAGVPIIAFTDVEGDTADVLSRRGFGESIVAINDRQAIGIKLRDFAEQQIPSAGAGEYDAASDSRIERARAMAGILRELC